MHAHMIHDAVTGAAPDSSLDMTTISIIVFASGAVGLLWALINFISIRSVEIPATGKGFGYSNEVARQNGLLLEIGHKISQVKICTLTKIYFGNPYWESKTQGASEFLKSEYLVCFVFTIVMFVIIYGAVDKFQTAYTAFAFLIGAVTSMACGAIGMLIATFTNYRVAYKAKEGLAQAFTLAYRGGCVMGFALVSIAVMTLLTMIVVYKEIMGLGAKATASNNYYHKLFEAVAGYGLGGSMVALFGRVGGGIYTKAADVGADLVGKIQTNLPEDSPKNPATIADNVGDNVGDIAGMGADLFGSFAESTCAALVISSTSLFAAENGTLNSNIAVQNLMFPLLLTAVGILVCLLTSIIGVYCFKVDEISKIQNTLKYQLLISTLLLVGGIYVAAILSFPKSFVVTEFSATAMQTPLKPYLCTLFGLVAGLLIGGFTEYMTSHSYRPVQQVAESCRTGAGTNVIYGLALGYMSTLVPVLLIAATALGACKILGFYGIALAALGMLSNLPISLAIDAYGPISDNAGGIAQMSLMGPEVRDRTDALDAAGNTTAAVGKGFAIGSAALVAISLFGAFLHVCGYADAKKTLSILDPVVFACLLVGAMLPYVFSAMTMKSVGKAALGMVQEVRKQIRMHPGILDGSVEPDYKACIRISTNASLVQMIAPGLLVILTPFVLGVSLGPVALAGFLPGAISSGIQMAISAANTGGAWDNAKKYIQGGYMRDELGHVIQKRSQVHKAAVVGDTVGDPLKDTSGPSLNILIKLMAILSLVFAPLFIRLHP